MSEIAGDCCGNGSKVNYSLAVSFGLLFIRLGLGIAFIMHGYPKITGGVVFWEKLGGAMGVWGITFAPAFWGFMAAFAEFGGGILLAVGLFVRPAAFLIFFTMVVATTMKMNAGGGFSSFSYPMELGIVFFGLMFTGGGKFALGYALPFFRHRCYR